MCGFIRVIVIIPGLGEFLAGVWRLTGCVVVLACLAFLVCCGEVFWRIADSWMLWDYVNLVYFY